MPKISVIMPLYNAQKYLKESLDSVLNQTFKDLELICVNDASEDATIDILKQYQCEDSRIIVLENEKRFGAAYSRNKGIQHARGKYLIFLDGDDLFEEEMLKVCFDAAEKKDTDVLLFCYKHVPSERIRDKKWVNHGESYINKYYDRVFSVKESRPYEFLLWTTSPCDKLFKKDFIISNQIAFQSLPSFNDVYFVNMALMLSERTMVLADNRVMVYARDHSEPSRISNHRDPMFCFEAFEHLMEELVRRGRMQEFYRHFFYKAFFAFKSVLQKLRDTEEAERFYNFLQKEGIIKLREKSNQYLQNSNSYIESIFTKFQIRDLSSEWLDDESILKVSLLEEQKLFSELFSVREDGRNIVLWGAGRIGKTILEVCNWKNFDIDYVVDESRDKQGQYIEKHLIRNPQEVLREPAFVIASPYGLFEEIRKSVFQYNEDAIVIDICSYMAIT